MAGGRAAIPPIDAERVADYIVRQLRWYVLEQAGKDAGIVGISGGIDSSVTAYLTARALGPERTRLYILPSEATPKEDLEDALSIVERLEVPRENWEIIRIDEIVSSVEEALGGMTHVERGNVMARIRMIILHQRAYRHNGLVVGSGDKSELLLGYFTKYGDGGVDVLPIGGLYKTHVRQLARHLGVPERIIEKPSSPRLWPGQTAEGELGASYEVIDAILYHRFEEWLPPREIADKLGISKGLVDSILERVKKTQHKRMMPPVFHLSFRDVGSDWRYPRDWS